MHAVSLCVCVSCVFVFPPIPKLCVAAALDGFDHCIGIEISEKLHAAALEVKYRLEKISLGESSAKATLLPITDKTTVSGSKNNRNSKKPGSRQLQHLRFGQVHFIHSDFGTNGCALLCAAADVLCCDATVFGSKELAVLARLSLKVNMNVPR